MYSFHLSFVCYFSAEPGGLGMRPLACWNCGFKYRQQHVCLALSLSLSRSLSLSLSFVTVVCSQVRPLCGADHPSGGVLQSMMCLSVVVKPRS